ncbi:MAG: hypothetical protein C6I01_06380 [Epsilonproteobacteria bacterium]|jgi:hypothetical protein|nr:hypothetical protein [Campylobacterota bacterium]NPA89501.1 hypothetical protein [Campylobacterota bacterium]
MEKKQAIWIGSALGLGVMMVATPPLFQALMKKGLEKRIEKLKKFGFELNLTKDQSNYFKTDKVYHFVVNRNGKEWEGDVEISYLNLPVTSVDFNWTISRYTPSPDELWFTIPLKKAFWEGQKGEASSRDLKHFTYQIYPIQKKELNTTQLEGEINVETDRKYSFTLNGDKLSFQEGDTQGVVTNFTNKISVDGQYGKYNSTANIMIKSPGFQFYIGKFAHQTSTYIKEKVGSGESRISFSTLQANFPTGKSILNDGEIDIKTQNFPLKLIKEINNNLNIEQLFKILASYHTQHNITLKIGNTTIGDKSLGDVSFKLGGSCNSLQYQLIPCNITLDYFGSVDFTTNVITPMLSGFPVLQRMIPFLFKKDGTHYKLSITLDGVTGKLRVNDYVFPVPKFF